MKKIICFLLHAACLMAGPVLTLEPGNDPARSGAPGTTVGWGFRLTPDANEWIGVTASFLLNETNPSLGFYVDLIGSQGGPEFGVLPPAPYADWVQEFDAGNFLGLGMYAIDPGAAIGAVNAGTIRVLYERYSGDPGVCGSLCFVDSGELDVVFSVTVDRQDVPEPGSWGMGVMGLASIWGMRRLRRAAEFL